MGPSTITAELLSSEHAIAIDAAEYFGVHRQGAQSCCDGQGGTGPSRKTKSSAPQETMSRWVLAMCKPFCNGVRPGGPCRWGASSSKPELGGAASLRSDPSPETGLPQEMAS